MEKKVHSYRPAPKVKHYKPEAGNRVTKEKEAQEIHARYPGVEERVIRIKLNLPQVLSKRQRRMAKKRFPKHKQVPHGYQLLYRAGSSLEATPQPTPRLIAEWAYLDMRAKEMFRRKYDKLTKKQKDRLIESFHKEDQ